MTSTPRGMGGTGDAVAVAVGWGEGVADATCVTVTGTEEGVGVTDAGGDATLGVGIAVGSGLIGVGTTRVGVLRGGNVAVGAFEGAALRTLVSEPPQAPNETNSSATNARPFHPMLITVARGTRWRNLETPARSTPSAILCGRRVIPQERGSINTLRRPSRRGPTHSRSSGRTDKHHANRMLLPGRPEEHLVVVGVSKGVSARQSTVSFAECRTTFG